MDEMDIKSEEQFEEDDFEGAWADGEEPDDGPDEEAVELRRRVAEDQAASDEEFAQGFAEADQ